MLRFTKIWRWAPNYFRNAPRPRRSRCATAPARAAATTRNSYGTVCTPRSSATLSRVPPVASPAAQPCTTGPALTPMRRLVERARALLRRVTSATASEKDWQYVNFCARSEVFGPLHSLLPPVSGGGTAAAPPHALSSRRALVVVVVPDSPIATPEAIAGGARDGARGDEDTGAVHDQAGKVDLSLEALTVLLQLYNTIECEDGLLLRQLLGELRHTVAQVGSVGNTETCARDAHALPTLLLTLTEVGLIEEAVLQTVVRTPRQHTHTPRRRCEPVVLDALSQADNNSCSACLLSSGQMCRYTEQELVMLLVAWHRFGLHHDPVFARTVTALRRRLRRAHAVRSFARAVQQIKRRVALSGPGSETLDEHAVDEAAKLAALCAQLPAAMRCPMTLLVEAITALSQSVFRQSDVLTLLADLLAVEAAGRVAASHSTAASAARQGGGGGRKREEEMMSLSRQLLRATKLCEYMDTPQVLLATAFTWSCTASGKGIIVDGGEAGEVGSERQVYYDNVTADLIKLRHVD